MLGQPGGYRPPGRRASAREPGREVVRADVGGGRGWREAPRYPCCRDRTAVEEPKQCSSGGGRLAMTSGLWSSSIFTRLVRSNLPIVVVVGPFPPPTHGAARVTEAVARILGSLAEVLRVDTGVGGRKGLAYHTARTLSHGRALRMLLSICWRRRRSIYVGGAGGGGLWYQVAVIASARLMRCRIAYHHHSYAYLTQRSIAMRLLVYVAGPSACHIVLCEDMESALRWQYPRVVQTLIISNAFLVRDTHLAPSHPPHARRLRMVHVSNLRIDKGLGRAIDSLRTALHDGLDVELLLAGPPGGSAEMKLLHQGGKEFGDRLRHVGPLAAADVHTLLSGSDLFIFPSLYRNEAEPLVVLEAMAAGVPVLAYAVGCLKCMAPSVLPPVDTSVEFGPQVVALLRTLSDDAVAQDVIAESRKKLLQRRHHGVQRLSQLTAWLNWQIDTCHHAP